MQLLIYKAKDGTDVAQPRFLFFKFKYDET